MPFDVYKCFMPECCLDTCLIEFLLGKANPVNHQKGNSSIAARMKSSKYKNSFVVGIIDQDKRKLEYLNEFFEKPLSPNGLKIFQHKNNKTKHFFIQICPAIEAWMIEECRKANIDPAHQKYNLPNTVKALSKLKSALQKNDIRFKTLFSDLLNNENCNEMQTLKKYLHFLKEKNYDADLNQLTNV
jgi:hypothetical protein